MTRMIIDPYPHRMAGHCGSGALRDLIDWAGLGWDGPPSEALVFGLGGTLSFLYLRLPGLQPPIYLVGRNGEMELGLCRRLGIEAARRETDDAGEGWRWVTDELDQGRPVMVCADIAELPYLRVRLTNTMHDIVVIGYDDQAGVAYVVDNDRADVQSVPLDALARARASSGFPGPNRHATFPMRFPERLPDLLGCARSAAGASAGYLTTDDRPLIDAASLTADAVIAGTLDGMKQFASDIAAWPDILGPDGVADALRALPVFIEKAGTGGGLFRRLQADFCLEVAERTGDGAFRAAGEAYSRCAASWSELGALAKADRPDMTLLAGNAHRLCRMESDAAVALREAARE